MAPLAVDKTGVPADVVERERRIFEQQVRESGKPENLVPKIVEGKVEAFYKQSVLLSQEWVRDSKKTIGDLVKEASAKMGENIVVRRFARFELGKE
jgi:elongation factor Ts